MSLWKGEFMRRAGDSRALAVMVCSGLGAGSRYVPSSGLGRYLRYTDRNLWLAAGSVSAVDPLCMIHELCFFPSLTVYLRATEFHRPGTQFPKVPFKDGDVN